MSTIVCISDTHGRHEDTIVPDGDILIHAGDLTEHGWLDDVTRFDEWIARLPHRHKIVICGNHDWCFQQTPERARVRLRHGIYLEDESVVLEGLRFYGSPWQPWFLDWAFNLPRGPELAAKWALIPDDTDVLITHGPPFGIADQVRRGGNVGCADLLDRVRVVRPRLHVFGHIHEAGGIVREGETLFVNASTQMGRGKGIVIRIDDGAVEAVV